MIVEFTRLTLGLLIALFHRPIADFILGQERTFHSILASRGVTLPGMPSEATARNIYFGLGIFVAVFEIGRIWTSIT